MKNMTFDIIVAIDKNNGIGKNGELPWRLPGDMEYFKDITTRVNDSNKVNAVVMGRKTWDSIPVKFRPLRRRLNIVLTRNEDLRFSEGVEGASSFESAINLLSSKYSEEVENVFIIGGYQLFAEAMGRIDCKVLYVTEIDGEYDCDTFFPEFKEKFVLREKSEVINDGNCAYSFCKYEKIA